MRLTFQAPAENCTQLPEYSCRKVLLSYRTLFPKKGRLVTHLVPLVCRLVVVGGGYIGCEQASIFNNFGTEVHLIVRQVQPSSSLGVSRVLIPIPTSREDKKICTLIAWLGHV